MLIAIKYTIFNTNITVPCYNRMVVKLYVHREQNRNKNGINLEVN